MRKGLQIFLTVLLTIFILVTVADAVLLAYMDFAHIQACREWADKVAAGENTMDGLGVGIGIAIMIIFAAGGGVLALLALVLALILRSKGTGKVRAFAKLCIVLSVISMLVIGAGTPAAIMYGNGLSPSV